MRRVSNAFRGLAEALETVETDGTETADFDITGITPKRVDILSEKSVSTEIEIRIPFLSTDVAKQRSEFTAQDVHLTEDGSLHVEFLITAIHDDETPTEVESSKYSSDNTSSPGGDTEMSPEGNGSDDASSGVNLDESKSTGDGESEVAPYRDPDRLQEVYETHETFAEMTDALEVDVTPQTVRRYMIKHDIHEPASNTGSQSAEKLLETNPESISKSRDGENSEVTNATSTTEADSPQTTTEARVSTDGHGITRYDGNDSVSHIEQTRESSESSIKNEEEQRPSNTEDTSISVEVSENESAREAPQSGDRYGIEERPSGEGDNIEDDLEITLPEHLTLADVKTVAQEAKTLYEAERKLDLERDETRRLLRDLNLLDLVHGRVATREMVDRTIDDINRRLKST